MVDYHVTKEKAPVVSISTVDYSVVCEEIEEKSLPYLLSLHRLLYWYKHVSHLGLNILRRGNKVRNNHPILHTFYIAP